jgi:hypothetical protein
VGAGREAPGRRLAQAAQSRRPPRPRRDRMTRGAERRLMTRFPSAPTMALAEAQLRGGRLPRRGGPSPSREMVGLNRSLVSGVGVDFLSPLTARYSGGRSRFSFHHRCTPLTPGLPVDAGVGNLLTRLDQRRPAAAILALHRGTPSERWRTR